MNNNWIIQKSIEDQMSYPDAINNIADAFAWVITSYCLAVDADPSEVSQTLYHQIDQQIASHYAARPSNTR